MRSWSCQLQNALLRQKYKIRRPYHQLKVIQCKTIRVKLCITQLVPEAEGDIFGGYVPNFRVRSNHFSNTGSPQ